MICRKSRVPGPMPWIASFVAVALLGLSSPSHADKPLKIQTGPGAEVTVDGLHRIDNSSVDQAYAKPDVDLSKYTKILVETVTISYADDDKTLEERDLKKMEQYFAEAFQDNLAAGGYDLVSTPGPDVLAVEAHLINLKITAPDKVPVGRNNVFTASSGEATLVGRLKNSMSGETLAAFYDHKRPRNYWARATSVQSWSDVRRAFNHWTSILRDRMDTFHAANKT